MRVLLLVALYITAVSAVPSSQRIVGGSITSINNYPTIIAVLQSVNNNFIQICGGSILNQRSVLSAAHCFNPRAPSSYRLRAGSTTASTGGVVLGISTIFNHPNYIGLDSDISVLRTASPIVYSNVIQPASIAGPNYSLGDNEEVWAAGWGAIVAQGPWSEELRHVQVWTINQDICRQRVAVLTDNMLCAGWLNVGGRDTCSGDSGGPLYHRGVVVGVTSFGYGCADPWSPGVYVRVSRFTPWVQDHA
ncbi:trypsin, alkaline C-like [Anticarsia gemmatalis]|uniref:trypsin, alkaline C-like n=1 Tax=Anticarsia gemmatalis TaxID=129554 RepID=UPI003F769673